MPLGIPNRNAPADTKAPKKKAPTLPTRETLGSNPFGGTPLSEGRNQGGPVAPGILTPSGTPYSSFQATPEYSNQGAWGPSSPSGLDGNFEQMKAIMDAGIRFDDGEVENFLASGLDPFTWAGLGARARESAVAWGTNLSNSRDITGQQQSAYDVRLGNQQQDQAFTDEFGAIQNYQQDSLLSQYKNAVGTADERYALGERQLQQGRDTDLGLLAERRYRDVDLAGQDNRAGLLNNSNQRDVLDQRRGIRGESFQQQQDFLNQQTGFVNDRATSAYNQFQSTDQYGAQQSQDLMAQYGFAGRQYGQEIQDAFANKATQTRAASSDAASRGAFGSAGYGDNVQDIAGQYQRATDASSLGLDRTNEGLDARDRDIGQQRKDLRIGYDDQRTGFNQEVAGINDAQQRNNLGYRDDLASYQGQYSTNDMQRTKLEAVDKGLASLAKEYGLKEQDMKNAFKNAMDKMGLDLTETNEQLAEMLNSGNAQLMAQATSFQQQAVALQQ
jgi:hypothetical protein